MLKRFFGGCARFFRQLWQLLSQRFWMKALSLLLAILLWNYVVSTNTSITRDRTVGGLTAYVTNQAVLTDNKLAFSSDPAQVLQDVTVTVEVPQSSYSKVSAENIKVSLDVSGVRTAGAQEVALHAVSTYGRVVSVFPETVSLSFEKLDARSIPVTVQLEGTGEREDTWFNLVRNNPGTVTVSGAASVVQSIAQARVNSDVGDAAEGYRRAEPFILLDADGNEVAQTLLDCSASSITVLVDAYPMKEIPISSAPADTVTGQCAEGFVVSSVTLQPETVTVAAEKELLDGITEVRIEPVSAEGASQSFSVRADISQLAGFKYVSSDQVYVNVTVDEASTSEWLELKEVRVINLPEGVSAVLNGGEELPRVLVTGPVSSVDLLKAGGLSASIDAGTLIETEEGESVPAELVFDGELTDGLLLETEKPVTIRLIKDTEE